jgi:hypothetical protein
MLDRILREIAAEAGSVRSGGLRRSIDRMMRFVVRRSFDDAFSETSGEESLYDRIVRRSSGRGMQEFAQIVGWGGTKPGRIQSEALFRRILRMAEEAGATPEDLRGFDLSNIHQAMGVGRAGGPALLLSQISGISDRLKSVFSSFEGDLNLKNLSGLASTLRAEDTSLQSLSHRPPPSALEQLVGKFSSFMGVPSGKGAISESMENFNKAIDTLPDAMRRVKTGADAAESALSRMARSAIRFLEKLVPQGIRDHLIRAGARIGGGLAERLGLSQVQGMRGGAALGRLAGPALLVAGLYMAGRAAFWAGKKLLELGDRAYRTTLRVADYDGSLALSRAQLNVGRIQRDIRMAHALSDRGSEAMREINRFEQNMAPINEALNNVGLFFQNEFYRTANWFLDGINKISEIHQQNSKDIEKETRDYMPGMLWRISDRLMEKFLSKTHIPSTYGGTAMFKFLNETVYGPQNQQGGAPGQARPPVQPIPRPPLAGGGP